MLLYRVFLHDPAARPGANGHASFLYRPQGAGRWDNPGLYDAWYLSREPEGAVGETFGNIPDWTPSMLQHPDGRLHRALATFSVPDDIPVFDFDDPANLVRLGMRPSRVVVRNKAFTQGKAALVFAERDDAGKRRWAGLGWWSFHRPTWDNIMLWHVPGDAFPLTVMDVAMLTMSSPALIEAARALNRPIP